ncbi:TetR/AcrR family transcriptional regulator [Mycobacterium spongiae]|uniref:TetR family transcriptional regulator n=1 Tax=Mycobacterium spongiae TaxID=886343 RepID=A0A975K1L4_9MYCO|nr:TetR/AcrR family transcriptional regulator [Mycobacterium spongiae]QUR69275.1 TetR family transcriptional regulator [Mycobacterium spongiae]
MAGSYRRLLPEDRRAELLVLGSEVFGSRPYDEVRLDEIAAQAGISRALMYHYFRDKKAFFAAVMFAEGQRLFDLVNAMSAEVKEVSIDGGRSLFEWLRDAILVYLRHDEAHPHSAWVSYVEWGRSESFLRATEDIDFRRSVDMVMTVLDRITNSAMTTDSRGAVQATVSSWMGLAVESCNQRVIDPSLDAALLADTCADMLLDALGRLPGLPADFVNAITQRSKTDV